MQGLRPFPLKDGLMRRWSRFPQRRQLKRVRLAALIALAIGVAALAPGGWLDSLRRRWADPFPSQITGSARLIDGDSLWVGLYEVRLKGIDAPEGRQTCRRDGAIWKCGDAARDALSHMIERQTVTWDVRDRDRYNRLLADCRAGDRNLNAGMVAAGMAVAYGGYWREEAQAKAARRGLWDSQFETPRQWRDANPK
jgi:endonuclease YncB( thermonuclease family)